MHPREFGTYRIVKLLPLGGMGRVYLAIDSRTNEQVALKLIEIGPDPERQEILAAERRGAVLQSRLCVVDPRVTVIRSFGEMDGFFYIEMEYVEGQDLAEVLHKGPLGVPFAARIGQDICEVLQKAHNFNAEIDGQKYRGIVHGDIKPRNIRITPTGKVKVLDFGIAKALSLTRSFTTNRFASSQYSSPERLATGDVDVASDLWSTAVVLYEVVTAKPYFQAEQGRKLELEIQNYQRVRDLPSQLPADFQTILRKALQPDQKLRYGTALDFASDLLAFLEKRPVAANITEDTEATRRIQVSESEDEGATRRTTLPVDDKTVRTSTPKKALPVLDSRRLRQARFFGAVGLALIVSLLFFNEFTTWKQASQLAYELDTEKLDDLNAAWDRYDRIAKSGVLPIVYSGARKALRSRLTASADRTLGEYRTESRLVSEGDWTRSRAALARALELDRGDKEIRGKMYVTEGHIDRINGTSRGLPKLLHDGRAKFEEASDLISRSPDPYLGLARLYVYGLHDIEKAEDALKNAERRGYRAGRREKAQLADGYRDRADRLMREAKKVADLPEEKDLLERAREDYRRAESMYRDIMPFASSGAGLRRSTEQLELIEARLEIIKLDRKEGA